MNRQTVIVVEDEPLNRLIAVDVLEDAGFEVVDFGRADDVMDYVASHEAEVAALFTDINVPGDRDGIDLARAVAQQWPRIAVLVTSGRFGNSRPHELPDQVAYMTKPWRAQDVVSTLRAGIATVGRGLA